MESGLYSRMRTVACRYWSCAPPELDEWIQAGRVSVMDILELVHMLAHDPLVGIWLMDYIYPEDKRQREIEDAEEKRRKQREQWNLSALRMLQLCPPPKDDKEAAQMAALKETLAHGD